MAVEGCLFCGIVAGRVPATLVLETPDAVAFRDIAPKAPVHILVVPRRHVASPADAEAMPVAEKGAMLDAIARVAREAGLEASGYRVAANHGRDAHQSVFHLHWHVLGGGRLSESM